MHKLCPFCHKWMSTSIFQAHLDEHMKLRPDGQMNDHITVRPEERFAGDIAKEPQWYVHPKCGGVTGMPEDIIRSYISDPFLYNETSFCTGCKTYVPTSELFWQETNESLLAASYRRKAEFIQRKHLNPDDFVWDVHGPSRRKCRTGSRAGWVIGVLALGGVAALFLFGVIAVFGVVALRAAAGRGARPVQPVAADPFPNFGARTEFDFDNSFEEMRKRQDEQFEEMRRRNDEMIKDLTSPRFNPPTFRPPPIEIPSTDFALPPEDPTGGIEGARQRAEEARQRAQERIDSIKDRLNSRFGEP